MIDSSVKIKNPLWFYSSQKFSKTGLVLFLLFLVALSLFYKSGDYFLDFKNDLTREDFFNETFSSSLNQNDTRLLNYIRKNYLIPPSKEPYNLEDPNGDPSLTEGQTGYVSQIFNNMRGGFFVESGALDGEKLSTTLALERDYQWKGLLVEASSYSFEILRSKNRKAWSANVCLSPVNHSKEIEFNEYTPNAEDLKKSKFFVYSVLSSIIRPSKKGNLQSVKKVPCFPVFSILAALNVHTVDFFSLDIEGFELDILRTIPFDSILIKVICVEWAHVPEGKAVLREYVESKGYKLVKDIEKGYSRDFLFVHNSVPIPATLQLK